MERQTGKRPAELDGQECPRWMSYLWGWWVELHSCRRSNGFGPEPISHLDILAWAMLTDVQPSPDEIAAVMALDRAYRQHIAEISKRK